MEEQKRGRGRPRGTTAKLLGDPQSPQQGSNTPPPQESPENFEGKALWIVVTSSDGRIYQIPADFVIEQLMALASDEGRNLGELFHNPVLLLQECSKIPWVKLFSKAIEMPRTGYVDMDKEWVTQPKSIIFLKN